MNWKKVDEAKEEKTISISTIEYTAKELKRKALLNNNRDESGNYIIGHALLKRKR